MSHGLPMKRQLMAASRGERIDQASRSSLRAAEPSSLQFFVRAIQSLWNAFQPGRAAIILFPILCPYGPIALKSKLRLGREDILFLSPGFFLNHFLSIRWFSPYNTALNCEHGRRCPAGKPGAGALPAQALRKQRL